MGLKKEERIYKKDKLRRDIAMTSILTLSFSVLFHLDSRQTLVLQFPVEPWWEPESLGGGGQSFGDNNGSWDLTFC
ncbi:hypothetical protein Peur_021730 [Populus x canadensis]